MIRRHAQLDIHHARDLYALIDQLPLTSADEAAVAASALHTIDRGIDILSLVATGIPDADSAWSPRKQIAQAGQ